jgi:hypothetical protein
MSDNWAVGDLALCVKDSPGCNGEPSPCKAGNVYRVELVVYARQGYIDEGKLGLRLEGVSFPCPLNADLASRYRKIKPDTEPCEEEFALLIKRKVDA